MVVHDLRPHAQEALTTPEPTRFGRALGQPAEWLRYLAERYLVIPAADYLPKRAALLVADVIGFIDALVPTATARIARREMTASTSRRGWHALVLSARHLAGPRRDLVVLRRFRRGREHPSDWKIVEVHREIVDRLLEQHGPFLIATAHFHYAAELVVPDVLIPQSAGWCPNSATPARRFAPDVLRERLENRVLYNLERKLLGQPDAPLLPRVGEGDVMASMLARLRQPGAVARLFVDAHWEKPNAHRRSFAGIADRGFAFGVTRLARLAQCPIVVSVCTYDADDTVRVEWGPCFEPPAPDDMAMDVLILDRLLDALERAVGRSPVQYLHPMGCDRPWHAEEQYRTDEQPVPVAMS